MTTPETPAWSNEPMTALDLETTGIDPESARIVSAALVSIQAAGEPSARTWLVDPGTEIPAEAAAVHGITTDHAVKNGRPPADAVAEIAAQIGQALTAGQPLIVFRAPYALTVLAREAARHDAAFPTEVAPVIDPAVIDKQINRYRPGRRTLPALCEHYQVRHDGPNQAVEDALAAARLTWRLLRVRPQLAALGLERHLRRTDPTATVNPAWPLLPTTH
ncbi:exonuclease domain-containing protein [Streptomyces sp. NBC_00525]|uniref:exonuclease domain-containing protein n=1 Tax=Streptomyces sp. NBC_00525 TaxID=2903660 RepID=UPI002E8064DA|nr:exonuclease domain-containing protein [Streptomyces sp. NBC_00525]WUC94431.1 exonuclease domain-containing protein [Streptomyces sp. NBC_00525]